MLFLSLSAFSCGINVGCRQYTLKTHVNDQDTYRQEFSYQMIPKTDVVIVVVVIMIILIQYIITNYNSSKGKSPVSLVTFWESRRVPSLFLLISLFSLGFLCLLVFLPVIPIVDEQGAAEILLGLLSSFVSFCFP